MKTRFIGTHVALFLISAAVTCSPFGAHAVAPKLGAIGDSLVDEHFDQGIGYSKNWYELMIQAGKIDAGPLAPGWSWGDSRKSGYQYNFAVAGATTETMIADAQHTRLASLASSEGITRAVMVIGANDFFPVPPSGIPFSPASNYEAIYEGLATQEQIEAGINSGIQNAIDAIQQLKTAGIHVVVATVPDYGIAPYTKFLYSDPTKREHVTDVIRQVNSRRVPELANDLRVPLVDIFTLTKDVWGQNGSENETFDLGGVLIDLDGIASSSATNADTDAAFAHDGIHPINSVGGVFANVFMTAFNQYYGDSFNLFSVEQVLANAGPNLAAGYDGVTTLESALGRPLSDYVIEPIGNPCDFNGDGAVDAADAGIMFADWGATTGSLADKNGDGFVDAADAGVMFAAWTGDAIPRTVPEPLMLAFGMEVIMVWIVASDLRHKKSRRV